MSDGYQIGRDVEALTDRVAKLEAQAPQTDSPNTVRYVWAYQLRVTKYVWNQSAARWDGTLLVDERVERLIFEDPLKENANINLGEGYKLTAYAGFVNGETTILAQVDKPNHPWELGGEPIHKNMFTAGKYGSFNPASEPAVRHWSESFAIGDKQRMTARFQFIGASLEGALSSAAALQEGQNSGDR